MTATLDIPPARTDTRWRRLSPRMLLVQPVIELGRALPALAGLFVAGSRSGGGSAWSLIGAAVVIGVGVLHWVTTRYRITSEQVELRRGLLRKVSIAAPRDRVRTVDVSAHPLHRALGLAQVAIGTGTSDRHRTRLVLDGLPTGAAARLRGELLHRAEAAPDRATPQGPPHAADELIVALDLRWIRFAPFTLSGAIATVAVLGFGWRLLTEAHVRIRRLDPLRVFSDFRHTSVPLDLTVSVIVIVVVITIASTVGYAAAFWGFRLSRNDGGSMQITRGLFTSRATSIERRRMVGVEVSEPLLLRLVGGARCLAIATGLRVGRGAEHGGGILLPAAPRGVALHVATAVIGVSGPVTADLQAHPRRALRRRLTRVLPAVAVIGALTGALVAWAQLSPYAWLAPVVVLLAAPVLAVDRYRGLGHAVLDGYLVTRIGSLVRRRHALAADAVIGWNLRSSYFQRRADLLTLEAATAAGRQRYVILDVDPAHALAVTEAVTPGLLDQFLAARSG